MLIDKIWRLISNRIFPPGDERELRSSLLQLQRDMAQVQSTLQTTLRELTAARKSLVVYTKRDYGHGIDPGQHNTCASMDKFFAVVEEERYVLFGKKVREVIKQQDIALKGKSVADWGIGPGRALKQILTDERPRSVTGFDMSEEALTHAGTHLPGGDFRIRDIYLPATDQYDVVLCTEVLEHLELPDRALMNLYDYVADGGTLVLTVPDGRIDYSRLHINFWSPESWKVFLKRTLPETADMKCGTFRTKPEEAYQNNFAIVRKP